MTEPALSIERVSHRYGEATALRDVSFEVGRGEVVGLLGRNGAGKTTLMRLITNLVDLQPDSGAIRMNAETLGYVPQRLVLWPDLTVREQLEFMADMQEVPRQRAAEVADAVGLTDKFDALGSALSGGMQRRLSIAMALIHRPALLLLDEPHVGLDPEHRVRLRNDLRALADDGVAVILSSHELDEVERLADRVVILDAGEVVRVGSPAEVAGDGRLEERFL